MERFYQVSYSQLCSIFGVSAECRHQPQADGPATPTGGSRKSHGCETVGCSNLDRAALIMLGAMLMQTMYLLMPTIQLSKGDAEDSDYEEEVNISMKRIDCVVHLRKLLDVNS